MVGSVALDLGGHLAAGTPTDGLDAARVSRVGDSPLPDCGFYADDGMGAVAMSGDGEMTARVVAARILHDFPSHNPDVAIRRALGRVATLTGDAGRC